MTRSAHRKLAAYPPERLSTMDILQVRLALRHDSRVRLELPFTYLSFIGGFEGSHHELHRFVPSVLAEASEVPALPSAGKGMTWTLLGVRAHEAPLARVMNRLYWALVRLSAQRDRDAKRSAEEFDLFLSELGTIFPRLALAGQPDFTDQPLALDYSPEYKFRFTDSPGVSRERFPLEVWVLVDPKDGYFQLVKGPIDLQSEKEPARR